MTLEFQGIDHRYGEGEVLRQVSLTARAGEVTCLLGPSGSGKSTLLRLAAGLERLQAGVIRLDGEVLSDAVRQPPPEARPVGLVFQDHVLFPHKTVRENVAFGLRRLAAKARREAAAKHLANVGLGALAERYPHTLSGGEQQRAALARALAPAPKVMLLDEPFASVDATLRRALRERTRRELRRAGAVALVVTHDPEEALELADRIVVLGQGRVVQEGAPAEIWRRPATVAVAAMFGNAQRFAGRAARGAVLTAFGSLDWPAAGRSLVGDVDVLARPAAVSLRKAAAGPHVEDVRFLGDRHLVLVRQGDDVLRASVADARDLAVGTPVAVAFNPNATFVYPRAARSYHCE